MNTVRRLYFYILSLISFIVVIWGVVGLLRTIVSSGLIGGSLLATGLSLVIVGLPIFYLHWQVAQRDARRDVEERTSRIRAVFLYAAFVGTLAPIVFALLALIDRELVRLIAGSDPYPWFGSGQTLADNLIAIVINAIGFVYFWRVLSADWRDDIPHNHLSDVRRLYRYLWVAAGLSLMVAALYNLLRFLFNLPGQSASDSGSMANMLAAGVACLLVGAPIWGYVWMQVQSSLVDPAERRSLLRLVFLYLISLAGGIGVLSTAGSAINLLIRWLIGEQMTLGEFFKNNSEQLGGLIPLSIMWWYYGRILNQEVAALPDQPRRAALGRLYNYVLSLLGLAVTFAGLLSLIEFFSRLAFARSSILIGYRGILSGALSALLVGLPLWLIAWRKMQSEALRVNDAGDHARRSVLRKTYLYLVLFGLVIGAMAFTGQLLYTLFNAALSSFPTDDFATTVMNRFLSLIVDLILLYYHWQALRTDGRMAQQSLGGLHAAFPTLILVEEENDPFGLTLVEALQRTSSRLPAAVIPISRGAPDETMLAAKAVLLPLNVALNPPESLSLWL